MSGQAEKGIGLALSADRTFRPMTGINSQVISQREDLPPHPLYKQFMAAARKIGSADRARKQSVSGKYSSRCVEAHPARGMAGSVDDRDAVISDLDDLALFQEAVGPCAETARVQTVNQNRGLCNALQFRDTAHVVNMPVGDEDILYGEA